MEANNIKNFKEFSKLNEQDEEERPFRLYGTGSTPEAELIDSLKSLIEDIRKANPIDQESYDAIKADIRAKSAAIKSHKSYPELKNGIPWQDGFIKLSDWSAELKDAVNGLAQKASKRGLV